MPSPDACARTTHRRQEAEIERLRVALSEIKGIGTGPISGGVSPEELRVACGLIASEALKEAK